MKKISVLRPLCESFSPLERDSEGRLVGGFGLIQPLVFREDGMFNNCQCGMNDCNCLLNTTDYPNNCNCTPTPKPTPAPVTTTTTKFPIIIVVPSSIL